jgi:exonuclease VII small subunit
MVVTYEADIKPLFRSRDVGAMKRYGLDLSKYQDVVAQADNILTRLEAGDMPCDGAWPPEKVALFAQWISDGKLEKAPPARPPVTFVADIKPLFRPRDIGAMRNFGGFDLSKYQDVVTHADNILTRLEAGDMPCDGAWPSEKVALFAQWISDGKLENPPPSPGLEASAAALRPAAAPKRKPKKPTKKTTTKKATKKKITKKKTTKKKTRARRG